MCSVRVGEGGPQAQTSRLLACCRKGFLARVPNPADRRGNLVRLTETGREVPSTGRWPNMSSLPNTAQWPYWTTRNEPSSEAYFTSSSGQSTTHDHGTADGLPLCGPAEGGHPPGTLAARVARVDGMAGRLRFGAEDSRQAGIVGEKSSRATWPARPGQRVGRLAREREGGSEGVRFAPR